MTKLLILAALAAATPTQPAAAQPASAPSTVIVAHTDLDLRTAKGVKTLDRRIWRAVVTVCGSAPEYDLAGRNDVRQCRRDTRLLVAPQAEQVIADAARHRPIRVTTRTK